MKKKTGVRKKVSRKKEPAKKTSDKRKPVKRSSSKKKQVKKPVKKKTSEKKVVKKSAKKPTKKKTTKKKISKKPLKKTSQKKASVKKKTSKKKTVKKPVQKKTTKKKTSPLKKTTRKISRELKKVFLGEHDSKKKSSKKKTTKKKTTKKKKSPLKKKKDESPFIKDENNPIISPNPNNEWEAGQTFNPTAIKLDGKIHFLYRAVGRDGLSRLGYASSRDGSKIIERGIKPAYEHLKKSVKYVYYSFMSGGSWGGCEDPRIVRVGDEDRLFLIYTACDGGLRIGLSSIKVEDFLKKNWKKWSKPKLISPPGEVHKNWVIFPEKINGKYAILHSINPDVAVEYVDSLDFKDGEYVRSQFKQKEVKKGRWDSKRRGVGPIPIKTKDGWLVFYHAEDHRDPGKYKIGAMLLDLNDPEKVLYRAKVPVLEPKEIYEMEGAKQGVVYTLGSVVREDGRLFVFYGGADNYVCVASADLENFLEAIKKGNRKPLKFFGFLKRKKKGKKRTKK